MVNDRDRERADGVVGEITSGGGSALSSVFDVTDYAAVAAAVDAFGGADILVNNAGNAGADGFGGLTPFVDTEPAQWEPYLRVNLFGLMHSARATLPPLVAQGRGRVLTARKSVWLERSVSVR